MADDDRSPSAPDALIDVDDMVVGENSTALSSHLLACGRWVCLLATATGWGVLLGLVFWRPWAADQQGDLAGPDAKRPTALEAPTPASEEQLQRQTALQRLKIADQLLGSGSLGSALEHYARIWKNPPLPRPSDHLLYRIAVARELVGNPDEALAHYQDVVRLASRPRIAAAAQLGQVRIWLKQSKLNLATIALCELAVHPEIAKYPDGALAGWRAHLFALATSLQADHHVRASRFGNVFDDRDCVPATPRFDGQDLLRLPIPANNEAQVSFESGVAVMYQFGKRPEQVQIRLFAERQSLSVTIESLAAATGWQLNWNDAARKRCDVHQQLAMIESGSLAMALDLLLTPVDLVWSFEEDRIAIQDANELADDELAGVMWQRAERAARLASTRYAGHPLAPFVYLTVGNAAFHRGDFAAAEAAYRQLLQLPPSSPTRTEATFNLAKTLYNTDQPRDALKMFYRAADEGQGHPLRSAAYAFAGRVHIELGAINESVRPLMRSAALAEDDLTKQVAAVTLASAYLLADNPHAANTALMRFRTSLDGDEWEGVAALVSSLARLQVATGTDRLRQGRGLITALQQVQPSDFFGGFGHLLIGRALETTGLLQQMVNVYEDALNTDLTDWLRSETLIALATHRINTAQYDQARRLLTELRESPTDEVAARAAIELARVSLKQELPAGCLAACQDLLKQELTELQKTTVLVLMGQAHQARHEHYEAALCFAGMIPGGKHAGLELSPAFGGDTDDMSSDLKAER